MGQLQGRWSGTAGQEGRGLGAQGQEEKGRGALSCGAERETAPSILSAPSCALVQSGTSLSG